MLLIPSSWVTFYKCENAMVCRICSPYRNNNPREHLSNVRVETNFHKSRNKPRPETKRDPFVARFFPPPLPGNLKAWIILYFTDLLRCKLYYTFRGKAKILSNFHLSRGKKKKFVNSLSGLETRSLINSPFDTFFPFFSIFFFFNLGNRFFRLSIKTR